MEQILSPAGNGKQAGHRSYLLATLRELFPAAFSEQPKPLKLGVHRDVIERLGPVSHRELRGAFAFYTGSLQYQRALKPGATRIDLDGNAAGVVTEDEAAHAQQTIAGIQKKLTARAWELAWEKRRASREQRRAAPPRQPAAPPPPAACTGKQARKARPR
jgi:ProP effector